MSHIRDTIEARITTVRRSGREARLRERVREYQEYFDVESETLD